MFVMKGSLRHLIRITSELYEGNACDVVLDATGYHKSNISSLDNNNESIGLLVCPPAFDRREQLLSGIDFFPILHHVGILLVPTRITLLVVYFPQEWIIRFFICYTLEKV